MYNHRPLFWTYLFSLTTLLIVGFVIPSSAQIEPLWDRSYGGSRWEELNSAEETADGGYILAGFSGSNANDGDVTAPDAGGGDFWMLKTNSLGDRFWDARFGGPALDRCNSVIQTSDGGFLLGGTSGSDIGGQKLSANRGLDDYWVVKTDATGNLEWEQTFGGSDFEILSSVIQTNDGGYLLGGLSQSGISGDKTEPNLGGFDYWIVKIDAMGNFQWDKTLGGIEEERLNMMQVDLTDGHFLLAGSTQSDAGDDITIPSVGIKDFWFVKVNNVDGSIMWQHRYGGSEVEELTAFVQTLDGGFFLAGGSNSDVSAWKSKNSQGGFDMWGLKIDAAGNREWDVTFGGSQLDNCYAVKQNSAGYYILGGFSGSGVEGDKTQPNIGGWDYWIVYMDESGNLQWDRTVGGTENDVLFNLFQNQDGGYILAGASSSPTSGTKTDNTNGLNDFWLVKTVCELELNFRDTMLCSGQAITLDAFDADCVDCLYDWSDIGRGDSIREVLPLSTQNYRVTLTDNAGCQESADLQVTLMSSPILDLGNDQTICEGTSLTLNTGATSGLAYAWSTGATTPTLSVSTSEAYKLTVTNSNNCSTTDSITVLVSALPIVNLGPDTFLCANQTLTLDAGNPGSTYQWSPTGTNQMEAFMPTGPQAISVAVADVNSCIGRDTLNVLGIYEPPSILDSTIVCSSDNNTYVVTFNMTGGNPFTHQVNSAIGFTQNGSNVVSDPIPRDDSFSFIITDDRDCAPYTFAGSDNCPCISSAGNADPTPLLICEGDLFVLPFNQQVLDDNDVVEYLLHDGDAGTIGNILLQSTQPILSYDPFLNFNQTYFFSAIVGNDDGTGRVDATDDCYDESSGVAVTFQAAPVADIISQSGSSVLTCEGSSSLVLSGQNAQPSGQLDFLWLTNDGQITSPTDGLDIEVNAGGTYQLIVENTGTGCRDTADFLVLAAAGFPIVNIETAEILTCVDTVVTLDATTSSQGGNFIARWNGGAIDGNTGLMQTVNTPGIYQLVITNTDNNCMSSESVMVVQDNQPPTISAGNMQFLDCESGIVELSGQILSPIDQFSVNWTTDDGNILNNESALNPTADQSGTYILQVINQSTGCSATSSVFVSPDSGGPQDAEISMIDPSCFGATDGSIMIDSVIGGVRPYLYAFSERVLSANNEVGQLAGGNYPITIQDANGCAYTTQVTLTDPNQFFVSLGEDQEIDLGDHVNLEVFFNTAIDTFYWNDTTMLSCANCLDPTVIPLNTSRFIFTAIDENGCETSEDLLVKVNKERLVYIPTAFSPNQDGVNDRFVVYGGKGIAEITYLQVFNRWGALIFENKNFDPNNEPLGWNGEFNNQPAANGVYIYQVKVVFIDGEELMYGGDVTLMR